MMTSMSKILVYLLLEKGEGVGGAGAASLLLNVKGAETSHG